MAGKKKKKSKTPSSTIALNKRARFEYHLEERFEAGLVLLGWEVKSLRQGRISFNESYITLKDGEAWLFGAHISPLNTASTHVNTDPVRTRKLLMHRKELSHLIGRVEQKGYTLVPVALYWKHGKVKLEVALAKGKMSHDKRKTEKERDWNREKQRILKS